MLGPDAAAAADRLRETIRDVRRYLTDEAVIWRAVAMSHDHAEGGHWPTREARARADAAIRALEPTPSTEAKEAER